MSRLLVKKPKTWQQLEEVAEKLPPPLSWFVPDPNDPTSYIHTVPIGGAATPVAMTTVRGLTRLITPHLKSKRAKTPIERYVWSLPREEFSRMFKLWLTHPEHLRQELKDIEWRTGLKDVFGRYVTGSNKPTPYIILATPMTWKRHAYVRTPYMTFSHELAHQIIEDMIQELGQQIGKTVKIPRHEQPLKEGVVEWLARMRATQVGEPYLPTTTFISRHTPQQLLTFEESLTKPPTLSELYEPVITYIRDNLIHIPNY